MQHLAPTHRDAADRPAASFRPDMAAQIDTVEDKLLELLEVSPELEEFIAKQIGQLGVDASPETMRVVTAIAAGVLRKADDQDMIQAMFGTAAPVREDLAEFARDLMALIDKDRNPGLQAQCADFVFGLGLNGGINQTQIAREAGVKRATVSKRCRNLVKRFGRKPARGMKSEEAVETYRQRQLGKSAKPEREPWSFSGMLQGIFAQPLLLGHGCA